MSAVAAAVLRGVRHQQTRVCLQHARVLQRAPSPLSSPSRAFAAIAGVYDPIADELYEPPENADRKLRSVRLPDMRSDTVTRPTAEMIMAIMDAPVGDDVYGEDTSVNRLQALVAEQLEMEAGLFVPSGTMGNLIAVAAQAGRGDEVVCGDEQHLFIYEQAGISQLFGIGFHTIPQAEDGTFPLTYAGRGDTSAAAAAAAASAASAASTTGGAPRQHAAAALAASATAAAVPGAGPRSLQYALERRGGGGAAALADPHYPRPAVLALENTHNRCGGAVLPQGWVDAAVIAAHAAGMAVHVDGARLYNAAAAARLPVARLVRGADSVSVCLSKGLGAPLGAVIAGSTALIARCRRLRKVLGGGMRQAGIAAACGIVGINAIAPALGADHARARSLARGLAAVRGALLDPRRVQSNIVFWDLDTAVVSAAALRARLEQQQQQAAGAAADVDAAELLLAGVPPPGADDAGAFAALVSHYSGVRVGSYGGTRLRAVTHHQIRDDDVERVIDAAHRAAGMMAVAPGRG